MHVTCSTVFASHLADSLALGRTRCTAALCRSPSTPVRAAPPSSSSKTMRVCGQGGTMARERLVEKTRKYLTSVGGAIVGVVAAAPGGDPAALSAKIWQARAHATRQLRPAPSHVCKAGWSAPCSPANWSARQPLPCIVVTHRLCVEPRRGSSTLTLPRLTLFVLRAARSMCPSSRRTSSRASSWRASTPSWPRPARPRRPPPPPRGPAAAAARAGARRMKTGPPATWRPPAPLPTGRAQTAGRRTCGGRPRGAGRGPRARMRRTWLSAARATAETGARASGMAAGSWTALARARGRSAIGAASSLLRAGARRVAPAYVGAQVLSACAG